MTAPYRDIFNQHRVLLTLPPVIAAVIALWSGVAAPKMYRSGATLWSDAPGSVNPVFGALPPAGQDQQLLNELLTTHFFVKTIADNSPLGLYLRQHSSQGWGPTAILSRLRSSQTFDDRVAAALSSKRVTSTAMGPHVFEVSYEAPTPTLAVQTLKAIIKEFTKQRGALRQDATAAAQKQVQSASAVLATARQKLNSYIAQHPSTGRSDPELQALATTEREAAAALAEATQTMSQAALAVAGASSGATVLRVVDPPRLPLAPTAGRLRLVKAVVAGLFAGIVVSILGLFALARMRRTQAGEEPTRTEIETDSPPAAQSDPVVTHLAEAGRSEESAEPSEVAPPGRRR